MKNDLNYSEYIENIFKNHPRIRNYMPEFNKFLYELGANMSVDEVYLMLEIYLDLWHHTPDLKCLRHYKQDYYKKEF